jgi:hypothetical protein
MRLKVEMNVGKGQGQQLVTEDGELVEGVKSIQWHADATRPLLTVELFPEKVDWDLGSSKVSPAEEPAPS